MRKSRFTGVGGPWPRWGRVSPRNQIIGMIKQQGSIVAQNGLAVAEVCRKHGISPASFYNLKAKWELPNLPTQRVLAASPIRRRPFTILSGGSRNRHPRRKRIRKVRPTRTWWSGPCPQGHTNRSRAPYEALRFHHRTDWS